MNDKHYPCEFCDTDQAQQPQRITVTRQRAGKWYIFEDVPALVCPNCGHRYFDAAVLRQMDADMKQTPTDARPVEAWAISLES